MGVNGAKGIRKASRTENAFRNSFWGILSKVIGVIFPFFFRMFIIRELGADYVGLNGLFKSIFKVLNLAELGFGSAIIFMMYKPVAENDLPEIRKLYGAIRTIHKYVGLFILTLGCCVYPLLNVLVKNNTSIEINIYLLYSIYLFDTVIRYFFAAYRASLFTAYQRSDILSKISLICEIVRYTLQAAVLYFTRNYYLYVLMVSVSVIVQNILYCIFSRKYFPDIYPEGKISVKQKEMIKSKVVPLVVHRIGRTLIVSIDDLILSAFLGISVLTQYDNYFYIINSVITFIATLKSSVVAGLGNKIYTSAPGELYKTYKKVYFIWIGVVGWCTCYFVGLFQSFISMWVGQKYVYDNSVMICICVYFFVWQFRGIGVTMKEAAGLWEKDRWKPVIGMALNLGLSILFVKLTGSVLGVMIPTIVTHGLVYFPWETHVIFKYIFKCSCKEYLRMTLKWIVTVIIAGTAVFAVSSHLPQEGFGWFGLRFLLCTVIPAVVIWAIHGRTDEFTGVIESIKQVLKKKENIRK